MSFRHEVQRKLKKLGGVLGAEWSLADPPKAAIFGSRLGVVMGVTQGLPVVFIPKQCLVALVGDDVIDDRCRDVLIGGEASHAEGMLLFISL